MPLPPGWTVTIADFQRIPDGSGAFSVQMAFTITGPNGQGATIPIVVSAAQVLQCQSAPQPKRCIALAAWQQAVTYVTNYITFAPAPPAPDPIIGTVFTPP